MKLRILAVSALSLASTLASAQPFDASLFSELKWRMIGPFRGGRTKAAVGVPGKPGLFYIGVVNGGVWKTTDYGHTWNPIFDNQPTGSGKELWSIISPNRYESVSFGTYFYNGVAIDPATRRLYITDTHFINCFQLK